MGSGTPAWRGAPCVRGRDTGSSGFPGPELSPGDSENHLPPQPLSLSPQTPYHSLSTSSGPIAYFLPQTEFGASPECSRRSHLLPVLTHLPCPDALHCFLVSCLLLPPGSLVPHPSSPEPSSSPPHPPRPLLPSPICLPVSVSPWQSVSSQGPGQGSSPAPQTLGQTQPGPQ